MQKTEAQEEMYVDLLKSERRQIAEKHAVTQRAMIYMHAGLSIAEVLAALHISRATWHRRVLDMRQWESEGIRVGGGA